MKFTLWAGPFDGFVHQASNICEFIELSAQEGELNNPTVMTGAVHPPVRYVWCASRRRYEYERPMIPDGR